MPFDGSEATITRVYPPVYAYGQAFLRWESSAPEGTTFQVYADRKLAWAGTARTCSVPLASCRVRVEIGAVAEGEEDTDFSSSLSVAPNDRARLAWSGGRSLGSDLAGFRVYAATSPNGSIDYAEAVATIPLGTAGVVVDGFGVGGFGQGGFGAADGDYEWVSGPLTNGLWSFAVRPYDTAGNEGSAVVASVSINAPPLPTAMDSAGRRLTCSYNSVSKRATLNWLASPG